MAYIIPYHVRKTSGIAYFDRNPSVWKYCIQRSCEPLKSGKNVWRLGLCPRPRAHIGPHPLLFKGRGKRGEGEGAPLQLPVPAQLPTAGDAAG